MVARCSQGSRPLMREVVEALELGVARLVSLRASQYRLATAATTTGLDDSSRESVEDVERRIEALRDALAVLRSLAGAEAASPLALGFVLPAGG